MSEKEPSPSINEAIDKAKDTDLEGFHEGTWDQGAGYLGRQRGVKLDNAEIASKHRPGTFGIDTHVDAAKISTPTETGTATYSSTEHTVGSDEPEYEDEKTVDHNTTVVRKDEAGKEVYRFTSSNPDLADKVSAIAAKRVIDATDDNQPERKAA